MRILVAGSRSIAPTNYDLDLALSLVTGGTYTDRITVVHGGARGADTAGDNWARANGFKVESHLPDWNEYGKKAGPIRNKVMAESGLDGAIFFWDGKSPGTRDMLNRVVKLGIPYIVIKGVLSG